MVYLQAVWFWGGGVFLVLDQARRVDTQVLRMSLLLPRATSCSNPWAAGLCACPKHEKRACLSKSINICTSGALATCWEIFLEIAAGWWYWRYRKSWVPGLHSRWLPTVFPGDKMPFPCRVFEHELGPLLLLMPLSMPCCSAGECGHLNQCSGSFSVGYKVRARTASVAKSSNDLFFFRCISGSGFGNLSSFDPKPSGFFFVAKFL